MKVLRASRRSESVRRGAKKSKVCGANRRSESVRRGQKKQSLWRDAASAVCRHRWRPVYSMTGHHPWRPVPFIYSLNNRVVTLSLPLRHNPLNGAPQRHIATTLRCYPRAGELVHRFFAHWGASGTYHAARKTGYSRSFIKVPRLR